MGSANINVNSERTKVAETADQSHFQKSYPSMGNKLEFQTPRQAFIPHPVLGWALQPCSKIKPEFRSNVIQNIDATGYRIVTGQPENSENTLAFYGCSFTYGTGLADHETFTSLLQSELPRTKIVNRGIGGYGNVQSYIQFRSDIRKGAVNAAVFCFMAWHRLRNVGKTRINQRQNPTTISQRPEHMPFAALNRHGRISIDYISLTDLHPTHLRHNDYSLDAVTVKLFSEIHYLAHANNIPLRIALLDRRDTEFNAKMCKTFDTTVDISTPNIEEYTFAPFDNHPNVASNVLFSKRLSNVVKELIHECK